MSQIMGLPADNLTKPEKDITVYDKGRYAGYQAAILDVLKIINNAFQVYDTECEHAPLYWMRIKVQALTEDKG